MILNCNQCYIHIKTNYYNVFCQKLKDLKLEKLIDFLKELEFITEEQKNPEEQKNLSTINKLKIDYAKKYKIFCIKIIFD